MASPLCSEIPPPNLPCLPQTLPWDPLPAGGWSWDPAAWEGRAWGSRSHWALFPAALAASALGRPGAAAALGLL